ncbi:MAG: family 43 glycosylhydrolase, partial [Bifidobacteriaceae bacterium]|nr:family 43 glycosylhydrolase [Bifidobacteriaceae bacterium]
MTALGDIQLRDPFFLRGDDAFYLSGSTDLDIWRDHAVGFDVYRANSDDLDSFDGPFPAFRPPAGFWSRREFWAPEIYRRDGRWLMFATFLPLAGRRGTAVLAAERPLGPFVPFSDGPVTPPGWECLDGTLFVEDAGTPWMVFCHEWRQVGDGEICAIQLSPDCRRAVGEPVVL